MAFQPLTVVLETISSLAVTIDVEDGGAKFARFGGLDSGAEGFVPVVTYVGGFFGFFRFFALLFWDFGGFF